ncbi:rhomboid family protein [Ulvibacter litoralis]|uniref:Membrane associated serine protease, rhomboid family n=1 Tax=Ulvibacter litoralis TaxID=227084 RepID=A0A1G7ESC0_9FLAO|nr:rhomboid family intramembrane serine protease [Ulvibacter litoralis]GHC54068.1 rhomboid family intramembrane serine protease [Ulvibacter litoralis]SDE66544.1 Membrane associated serine protease, rhomboid family [Ulvibacter litoralis]
MANNLTYQFKTANIIVKIIAINAVIFLTVYLASFFFGTTQGNLVKWFVLPENLSELILQPWSLFTYSFLHFGLWHVLFNMLWLYWFGTIILNLFTPKRLLTIYLLGGFFGGLLYVIAYNIFPVFTTTTGSLIGASGAVMAIMVFIATYTPNTEMRIFMFNIKLWHIAVFFLLLDLVQIPTSGNAGGLIAHLGGALFGYVYAVQLGKGKDIGIWFENAMDWVTDLFKPRTKKPFKKVHRTQQPKSSSVTQKGNTSENQKKIDAILDKIGKSGYESLTKAEKDFLFKAGKE